MENGGKRKGNEGGGEKEGGEVAFVTALALTKTNIYRYDALLTPLC